MKEITHIGPLHAGFVVSWVTVAAGFLAVFIYQVPIIVITSGKLTEPMLITLLLLPVGAGVFAFFGTIFACWNYNWISRRFGGIKIWLA